MATPEEILRNERIQKLENFKEAGIDPYPAKAKRDLFNAEVISGFKNLEGKKVTVVGRIMSVRSHGKISFFTIRDESGEVQLLFKNDELGEKAYKLIKNFDSGDFIEVTGTVFKTRAGEVTVDVKKYKLLTKALQLIPTEWYGLKDEDQRFRKRYLDVILNPDVKEMIVKRSLFWSSMRSFLCQEGFMEVETPALETTAGGADARPFVTHHNALDIDVYLRISAGELWQKRLMVAGFEKTFEIGRIFRNEGISHEHLQDYTQMEFYWAYADYNNGMKLVEKMYKHLAKTTFGTLKFKIGNHEVDLGKKWDVYSFGEIIKKKTGIDIEKTNGPEIRAKLDELKIEYEKKGFNYNRALDNLWKYCRKQISGPGFLIDIPVDLEPLAKRKTDDPNYVQRFQVILAGSEMGKGYSELNDPLDQAARFAEQQKLRDQGDEEAQMYDKDFVEALEYGMPPTCGFGVSERLFSFLSNKPSREAQIFPLMRPLDKKKK